MQYERKENIHLKLAAYTVINVNWEIKWEILEAFCLRKILS